MSRCLSCAGPDGFHEPHCQQERDSLRAENARLQDGYDGLKYQYDEEHDKLLRLQARVEELEKWAKCPSCGCVVVGETLCYSCLTSDIEIARDSHRQGSKSDADGSWDICLDCDDTWPCGFRRVLCAYDAAEALAERRKRAGQIFLWFMGQYVFGLRPAMRKYGDAARAAIEEETDDAR